MGYCDRSRLRVTAMIHNITLLFSCWDNLTGGRVNLSNAFSSGPGLLFFLVPVRLGLIRVGYPCCFIGLVNNGWHWLIPPCLVTTT